MTSLTGPQLAFLFNGLAWTIALSLLAFGPKLAFEATFRVGQYFQSHPGLSFGCEIRGFGLRRGSCLLDRQLELCP